MASPVPDPSSATPVAPASRGLARVRIQEADFDVGAELAALQGGRTDVGGLASFVGCVRGGTPDDDISALTLEHYPGMTERAVESMLREAEGRFGVLSALVIHRVGRLLPGERIVLVAVAASHRRDAFQACEFVMDYLKTHAPFWKKASTPRGDEWIDARVADDEAAARWGLPSGNAAVAAAGSPAAVGAGSLADAAGPDLEADAAADAP